MDAETNPPNNVNNRNNGNMVETENAECIEDIEDEVGSNEDIDTEPRQIILKPSLTTPSACAKEAMWEWMGELNHPVCFIMLLCCRFCIKTLQLIRFMLSTLRSTDD